MSRLVPASAAVILTLLLVSAARPQAAAHASRWTSTAEIWGPVGPLPPHGTLIVDSPNRGFTAAEVSAVRTFVAAGGRLLLPDPTPATAALLEQLDGGATNGSANVPRLAPGSIFDPDVTAAGTFAVHGAGVLGFPSNASLHGAVAVVGGGEALLETQGFAWLDSNGNGIPEPGEARGAYAVARIGSLGQGFVLVLGATELADQSQVRAALVSWAVPPILVDRGHDSPSDPIGITQVLAGAHARVVAALAGIVMVGVAAGATGIQVRRMRPARRRLRAGDRETLEMLAELAG
ncbi:MAG: DUF4350 domain-containing protein [Thermoplasmatota archaeon]